MCGFAVNSDVQLQLIPSQRRLGPGSDRVLLIFTIAKVRKRGWRWQKNACRAQATPSRVHVRQVFQDLPPIIKKKKKKTRRVTYWGHHVTCGELKLDTVPPSGKQSGVIEQSANLLPIAANPPERRAVKVALIYHRVRCPPYSPHAVPPDPEIKPRAAIYSV